MSDDLIQERGLKEEGIDEGTESTSKPKMKLLQINKKYLIVGGLAAGLILLLVIVLAVSGGGSSDDPYSKEDLDRAKSKQTKIVDDTPTVVSYTQEQVDSLGSVGYTGKEIEDYGTSGVAYEQLMEDARKRQKDALKQSYVELQNECLDAGSDAYKSLIQMTWLSGAERNTPTDPKVAMNIEDVTENVTYSKVPPRGNQLYLRLTMEDGTYTFYNVDPLQFAKCKDTGNMVITYNKLTYNDDVFITNIKEVPIK